VVGEGDGGCDTKYNNKMVWVGERTPPVQKKRKVSSRVIKEGESGVLKGKGLVSGKKWPQITGRVGHKKRGEIPRSGERLYRSSSQRKTASVKRG